MRRRLRPFELVLAGGGARGAYEAGVLRFVVHELSRRSGEIVAPRIVCGTSAGAINGTYIGARTGSPEGATELSRFWQTLTVDRVYRFEAVDLLRSPLRMLGRAVGDSLSLVDATPIQKLVQEELPWRALDDVLNSGQLHALVVAATEVAAGRCFYFMDRRVPGTPIHLPYPEEVLVHSRIRARHTLASAAIPFLFPPVDIDGEAFQDGGLRQNTPLTPALRLGAHRLLVIGCKRALSEQPPARRVSPADLSLTFLLGKAMNALLLDPIERELHRVERINQILTWGTREYGPDFVEKMNAALNPGLLTHYRVVDTLFVRPTRDLGELAAEAWRAGDVVANRPTKLLLSRIAAQETRDEADLLSYLLFDHHYTGELEALGFEDASKQEEALARFLGLGSEGEEPDAPAA